MIRTTIRTAMKECLYGIVRSRQLHLTNLVQAPNHSPLFKLRQKTGLAYSLCREALNKHENDVEEAEAWLKAQALAHGLQKATKVRDRNAREGLVGIAVRQDQKLATVLELNCETDFVAKNHLFQELALKLTEQVANNISDCNVHNISGQEFIEELRPNEELLKKIDDQVVSLITKLGENIRLHRALHFRANDLKTYLFGQIHAQAGQTKSDFLDISIGRFGAFTALRYENQGAACSLEDLKTLGDRLCRHVIGFSPTYIELPDNIRKHLEEVEREQLSRSSETEQNEGEEELSDDEETQLAKHNRDDWPSIMDQQLIMSDSLIVRDFCKENHVSIVHFQRFECGEST